MYLRATAFFGHEIWFKLLFDDLPQFDIRSEEIIINC